MDGACFKYQINKAVVPSGPNIMITDKKIVRKTVQSILMNFSTICFSKSPKLRFFLKKLLKPKDNDEWASMLHTLRPSIV